MLKNITDQYPQCLPNYRNQLHPPQDYVIPPPNKDGSNARELSKKTVIYMVDSRDRDLEKYPDPANYKIELNDEYKDIGEIELISAQLPSVSYTINKNNDQLTVYLGRQKIQIDCLHGYYSSGVALAKAIEESLHVKPRLRHIRVRYNSRLHKLLFLQDRQKTPHPRPPLLLCFEKENVRDDYAIAGIKTKQVCCPKTYSPDSVGSVLGFKPGRNSGCFGKVSVLPLGNKNMYIIRSRKPHHHNLEKVLIRPTYEDEEVPVNDPVQKENNDSHYDSDLDIDSISDSVSVASAQDSHYELEPEPQPNKSHSSPEESKCENIANPFTRQVEYIYLKDTKNPKTEWFQAKLIKKVTNQCIQDYDTWQICVEEKDYLTEGEYELWLDYIISPNLIDLEPHKYVLLKIPKLKRYQSNDSLVTESFAKLPLQSMELMVNHVNALGIIKYLNPPLPRLDTLHIQFYPHIYGCDKYQRKVFDFQGSDHILIFAFVFYKQSLKYKE